MPAERVKAAKHAGPGGARTGDFVRHKHHDTANVSLVGGRDRGHPRHDPYPEGDAMAKSRLPVTWRNRTERPPGPSTSVRQRAGLTGLIVARLHH
jgi:hypothetical protein